MSKTLTLTEDEHDMVVDGLTLLYDDYKTMVENPATPSQDAKVYRKLQNGVKRLLKDITEPSKED